MTPTSTAHGDNVPWAGNPGRPVPHCWLNPDPQSDEYRDAVAACYWAPGNHPRSKTAVKAWYRRNGGAGLALGAAVAGAGAWWVQGQRYGLQVEQLKHQHTSAELAGARKAARDMAQFQKGLTDAFHNFQATSQRNAAAQQNLDRSLRDLRGTTASLRGDFAALPERIAGAAQPALAQYASTCTAVLAELADRGTRLAERGAAIAHAADGHAADAALMRDAWPRAAATPEDGALSRID